MAHALSAGDQQAMSEAVGATSSAVGAIVAIILLAVFGCPLGCFLVFCLLFQKKQTGAQQLINTPQNVTVEMTSGAPVTANQV